MAKSEYQYLFESERLGFRNWKKDDFDKMIAISANKEVMRYFPAPATASQTVDFLKRMQVLFTEKGYCYFAVDLLDTNEFIGFIGLNDITYESSFSPATDIGWRLAEKYWGKGYATEGAKRCLKYGFETLKIKRIVATAPLVNKASISIMKKSKMIKILNFKHPRLVDYPQIADCVCYEATAASFSSC